MAITRDLHTVYDGYIRDLGTLPVSFGYGSRLYRGFPADAFCIVDSVQTASADKERNMFILQADENLFVEVDMSYYPHYGAYEWTVTFRNGGCGNTGMLHSVNAADVVFEGGEQVLRGILGDLKNQYRPYARALDDGGVCFRSTTGRASHVWFPYFNLEHGGGGTLIALGWGGSWEAFFTPDSEGNTRFTGTGTLGLCTYLKPGESVRTPLMAFVPYDERDEARAMNKWRSWYVHCNMPRQNARGEAIVPFSTTCLSCDTGLPNSDGSISERYFTWKPSLAKMLGEGIRPLYRWLDAGWYCDANGRTVESDWWGTVGSWALDTVKWPGGALRESVDFAREHGMKTLVWFEPERVTHVDELVQNYGYNAAWAVTDGGHVTLNNLGNDECLRWTLARITAMMEANDIDLYREDFNCDPAWCWAAEDLREGVGRAGITENKAVAGHYRLWDGIIAYGAAHGKDTFVDSCASGGGRNDLESMRRAIPLFRSDSDRTATALRLSMTSAFNKWIPFCGAGSVEQDEQLAVDGKRDLYILRASYNPVFNISAQWTQEETTDFALLRFCMKEWETITPFMAKDFYSLTPWNAPDDKTNWTSFCYFDPETDSGVLLAFRMEEAAANACVVTLPMLRSDGVYELRDADKGVIGRLAGCVLAPGYTLSLPERRSAVVLYITQV